MDNRTRGSTNALYNAYNDGITQRGKSTQRTCVIEQVYEILPQENKRKERNELKKIDAFKAKNSLSLHYSLKVYKMVRFTSCSWTIWTQPYLGFAQSWVNI